MTPAHHATPTPTPLWQRLLPAGVALLAVGQFWLGRRLWPSD